MRVIAIDPGTTKSAWIVYDGHKPINFGIDPNPIVLGMMHVVPEQVVDHCVIEKVESYGRPVGAEVFDTVMWVGRFLERFGASRTTLVERRKVVKNICPPTKHSGVKGTDASVRQAIIDRYGGKQACLRKGGTNGGFGALYGISADVWQALALAITWWEIYGPGASNGDDQG